MTLHKILREEEIANRREDRGEQDADGCFSLVEQSPNEFERLVKVAGGERVAELEDDAAARERHEGANVFQGDMPLLFTEEEIDLLKLAVDRPGVTTGEEDEEVERLVVKGSRAVCLTTGRSAAASFACYEGMSSPMMRTVSAKALSNGRVRAFSMQSMAR
jgi:hypothetical protein